MLDALGRVLGSIQEGPHQRRLRKYLDDAKTYSVLQDLNKLLSLRSTEVRGLSETFDAYCQEGSPPYWDRESFARYTQKVQPGVSEKAVDVLWRSFHYYACHPFPIPSLPFRVDARGFERAALLLAAQGTDLLGTQDGGDYFWRHDHAFFHDASFRRMFRSIGDPLSSSEQLNPDLLEDVTDVLASTQPYSPTEAPESDRLHAVAQRLLVGLRIPSEFHVPRADLATLLSLLLRMRLRKAGYRSRFFLGQLEDADDGHGSMADAIVEGVAGTNEQDLSTAQIRRVIDMLPNLLQHFHQLWALLFQPASIDHEITQPILIDRTLRAIALIIPRAPTQDTVALLERPKSQPEESEDLTAPRLIRALTQEAKAHVVLFTCSDSAVTVGAFFPGPLWLPNDEGARTAETKAGASHLLFQIAPQFRILRWTQPPVPLADIVAMEDETLTLEAMAADPPTSPRRNKAYSIGDGNREGGGLRIDPQTRTVTLACIPADTAAGQINWYRDLTFHADQTTMEWTVTLRHARLDIITVPGAIDPELMEGRTVSAKDQARYVREAAEPTVQGEELLKRIQGFGPGST